ncbi:MAG TPA: bifunctional precorrin-2 dehydrogenase/sirohydrochlorin ferrochelatase [Actinomycetota bacterium]|jgi:siroheme synthase-like protein
MAFGYPISLEVAGRRAVVIGRTAVAQGKADALLEAGAQVTVVSPGPRQALDRLERHDRATVLRRDYQPGDLEGAFLCVASSEHANVRAAVHAEARWRRVLVNVMDDIPHCDFAAPAVVRRGDFAIAISTGGRSPALARRLREELSRQFDPRWKELLDLLGEVRMETLPDLPDYGQRARRWQEALDVEVLLDLVGQGRRSEARAFLLARLSGVQGGSSNERGEAAADPMPHQGGAA